MKRSTYSKISVSSSFSSSEMTCMYFCLAICSMAASAPGLNEKPAAPGGVSHAAVTKLTSPCLLQADRDKERKKMSGDVNEDHTLLDNITVCLNRPLPLIY